MLRLLTIFLVATCILTFDVPSVVAQRRGDVVESLFKSLLEAHTERERRKRVESEERRHRHRPDIPANVVPPRPGVQPRPPKPRNAVSTYRQTLQNFVLQAGHLTNHLKRSTNVRGVRPLVAECWNLKTRASLIYQQCDVIDDPRLLSDAYCKLDCNWRTTSYKLQNLGGLDANCLACIKQMDRYSDQMCDLMGVDPQFNRDRMLELMVQGATYIETLVDDIEYELYDHPECDRLVARGRQLTQRIRGEAQFIRDASYDEVVPRFNDFSTKWRAYSGSLYKFRNPSIQRRLTKIRSTGEQIYELLWMPASVDRSYIEHLAGSMQNEVSSMLGQMTVQSLVSLPVDQQRAVLQAARELQSQCGTYSVAVKQRRSIPELQQQYRKIDQHWNTLSPFLKNTDSKLLSRCHNAIQCQHRDMRGALGMRQQINMQVALQLAAALEGLSEQLQADVHRYGRYYQGGNFRNRAIQSSSAFYDQSKSLHFMLAKGRDFGQLQGSCDQMLQTWTGLSELIDRMPQKGLTGARFNRVNTSRQELIRVVAQLAAMFTS